MPTVGVRVAGVGWSIDRRCDRTALRLMRTLGVDHTGPQNKDGVMDWYGAYVTGKHAAGR
jgi:hypothetical protein